MIELGRVDILYDTIILASFMVARYIRHMKQLIHIVSYLRKHNCSMLMMDSELLDLQFKGDVNNHCIQKDR